MESDLIRRQDALDVLGEEPLVWYGGWDEIAKRNQWRRAVKAIKAVPSAQPEIIHCKDCKRFASKVWLYAGGLADIEGRCGWTGFRVMPHDYCSYAIRREDE